MLATLEFVLLSLFMLFGFLAVNSPDIDDKNIFVCNAAVSSCSPTMLKLDGALCTFKSINRLDWRRKLNLLGFTSLHVVRCRSGSKACPSEDWAHHANGTLHYHER